MENLKLPRSKTFVSMDSLWYEEERLATFVDWPISFISPEDLAKDGFYYLRTKDHCACAFCRGVIGRWDEGDTPHDEHKRHFPDCAFVQGKITPNVPVQQGNILSKVSSTVMADMNSPGIDVCGTGKKIDDTCLERGLITKSSSPKVSMSSLGFRQYCGPKRKEYLTTEVRLNTFRNWPERVSQRPEKLAEAGFYYCGLSDHVRCFHCGNGLRNWEPEDDPWEEHARWYPQCHFVVLQKGMEFIDQVRRERPPFVKSYEKPNDPPESIPSSSGHPSVALSAEEMNKLLELDIMKHVLDMGFSEDVVKSALKKRLETCGQPFFSVRMCIDAVLLIIDQESKKADPTDLELSSSSSSSPSKALLTKFDTAPLPNSYQGNNSSSQFPPISVPRLPENSVANTTLLSPNSDSETQYPTLPNNRSIRATAPLTPLPSFPVLSSRASPPLRSSTPTSQVEAGHETVTATSAESSGVSSANSSIESPMVEESREPMSVVTTPHVADIHAPHSDDSTNLISEPPNLLIRMDMESYPLPNRSFDVPPPGPARSVDIPPARINRTPNLPMLPNRHVDIPPMRAASADIPPPSRNVSSIVPLVPTSHQSSSENAFSMISPPNRASEDLPPPSRSHNSNPTLSHTCNSSLPSSLDVQRPVSLTNVAESSTTSTLLSLPQSSHSSIASPATDNSVPFEIAPLISEAEVVMKEAAKLLAGPSATEIQNTTAAALTSGDVVPGKATASLPPDQDLCAPQQDVTMVEQNNRENVEMELERIREKRMCKVCMDKEMDVVFLPCTHMVTCSSCAVALASCPICRRDIQYAFKPIIS